MSIMFVDKTRCVVVIASHNRRETTRRCVTSLAASAAASNKEIRIVLLDDASADGTAEMLAEYPFVRVVHGDGSLYWAGGMRKALLSAEDLLVESDYVILVNDDTEFYESAMDELCFMPPEVPGIAVGATVDPATKAITYGGLVRVSKWRPLAFTTVSAQGAPRPVDTFHCNAVALTVPAFRVTGGLDARFSHRMADMDLGLRARQKDVPVVATAIVGECARNPSEPPCGRGVQARVRALRRTMGKKYFPPREWAAFVWRHGGVLRPVYLISPYMRAIGAWPSEIGRASRRGKSSR